MPLALDLSDRGSSPHRCVCCDEPYLRVWAFVHRDDELVAVYYATNYNHISSIGPETYIDVILGTWGQDTVADHVTFGCRIGPAGDTPEPDANYWEPCVANPPGALHGRLLPVEEAKRHRGLAEFWNVVDVVVSKDPAVHGHLYGQRERQH